MKIRLWVLMALLTSNCLAAYPMYQFNNIEQQQRFRQLTEELRCVVCQSQSLAESNAPLAQDIKRQIYLMVQGQQSTQTIKQYMVERYGDSVLYKPPLQANTYFLWMLPFTLLAMIFVMLPLWIKNRNNKQC